MADKDNENEFEDEFEFDSEDLFEDETQASAEDAFSTAAAPASESKKSAMPWLVIVVVLGVAGYFGWNFYRSGQPSEYVGDITQPAQPAPAPVAAAPAQPAPMPPQAQEPAPTLDDQFEMPVASAPQAPAETQSPQSAQAPRDSVGEEFSESMDNLKKDVASLTKSNTQKIDALEKDLSLSAGKIVNMDKALSATHQDIRKLTEIVKDLADQINEIQAKQQVLNAQQAHKARQAGEAGAPTYKKSLSNSQSMTIHAIIPGRAWIRTNSGKTITVAEGDMLGEYGKVLKIDAPTGTVITSSGVTIR